MNNTEVKLVDSSIIICSIVRDCAKRLTKNINVIEDICNLFKESTIVIFENDSKDNTKEVLKTWSRNNSIVKVFCEDLKNTKAIPRKANNQNVNRFFSEDRISKMAFYRNQYLKYISENNLTADYLMVVDLDVSRIEFDGVLDSFSKKEEWDAVFANGYSLSPKLKRRYHDTYALTTLEQKDLPQTEDMISQAQESLGKMKAGDNFVPVVSAFGGLAIYKFQAIKDLGYSVLPNNDKRVEVRCEHYSINRKIFDNGKRLYINPSMIVKYQSLSIQLIWSTIINAFLK